MLPRFRKARKALLLMSMPVPCLMVSAGGVLVRLLYSRPYWEAGWMLEVLSAGVVFQALNATISPILLATGDSWRHMVLVAIRTVLLLGCMAVGGMMWGSTGMLYGVAVSSALFYPVLAAMVRHTGTWMPRLDGIAMGLCVVGIMAGRLLRMGW
jgi:O-antigen/teichoic acid export membrane protein